MGSGSVKRVALLQGNATMRRLMKEFLEEDAFEVEFLKGPPPGAPRAHLVVIDVDSGAKDAERWIRHCDGRQLPVVISGVSKSRGEFLDRPWLGRPFTAAQLRNLCKELLILDLDDESDESERIPPPIRVGSVTREKPTLELRVKSPELEEDVGFDESEAEELLDVLDVDGTGSMILEIEDLHANESTGGVLVGKGLRRAFTEEELTGTNPWSEIADTDVELGQEAATDPARKALSIPGEETAQPSSRADVTTISSLGDVARGDFSSVHRVSSLLAEHWDQLGLTARTSDRAERIQRILSAMWLGGMEGVVEELRRIPAVHGFSGRLETLALVDLLHTIRDRRLRGRLEVGQRGRSFVLYIDGGTLEEIESLTENTDGLLLSILREEGRIDDETFDRFANKSDEEDIEFQLRQTGVVGSSELRDARRERAKRLLRRLCEEEKGTFAFIEVPHQSHQTWPTMGMNLSIDHLLLEVLRESSLNFQQERTSSVSGLVLDTDRAASLGRANLTGAEQEALDFFQQGSTVREARANLNPREEPVERVVERLNRLELLKKLGKGNFVEKGQHVQSEDPLLRPTRVSSSWEVPVPEPKNAGPEEETQQEVGFSVGVPEEFEGWEDDIDAMLSQNLKERSDEET